MSKFGGETMKKFLAFLLAFSVCLVCFGTYGFENAAVDTHDACDHDHSRSGHAVLAADDDTEQLYAEVTGSAYNETLQTLTVTFSVGSKTGNKISGGTVQYARKAYVRKRLFIRRVSFTIIFCFGSRHCLRIDGYDYDSGRRRGFPVAYGFFYHHLSGRYEVA